MNLAKAIIICQCYFVVRDTIGNDDPLFTLGTLVDFDLIEKAFEVAWVDLSVSTSPVASNTF